MTDCACIVVDDYDAPSFYERRTRKARVTHTCFECGREISPGETYEAAVGCWNGKVDVFKTCADCLSIREAFFCDGFEHGGMWETMWDHIRALDGEIPSSCLTPLTPKAREDVCEQIEACWGEDDDD